MQHYGSVCLCLSRHLVCVQWVEISCNLSGQKKNISVGDESFLRVKLMDSDQTTMKSGTSPQISFLVTIQLFWPWHILFDGNPPKKNVLEFPPKTRPNTTTQKRCQRWLKMVKSCQTTQKILPKIARKISHKTTTTNYGTSESSICRSCRAFTRNS